MTKNSLCDYVAVLLLIVLIGCSTNPTIQLSDYICSTRQDLEILKKDLSKRVLKNVNCQTLPDNFDLIEFDKDVLPGLVQPLNVTIRTPDGTLENGWINAMVPPHHN